MSERLWNDLEDSPDRRPIVIATLARELRLELVAQISSERHDTRVARPASRVADLHPRLWSRAERIRAMAHAVVELDHHASANALELMSREVTRMLETVVLAARISSGLDSHVLESQCSDSGTWQL